MTHSSAHFSRDNPSPGYAEALAYCRDIHLGGGFQRLHMLKHMSRIRKLMLDTESESITDYGCGHSDQWDTRGPADDALAPQVVHPYDPCVRGLDWVLQESDLVICTGVLHLVPEPDIRWTLREIFSCGTRAAFISVPCWRSAGARTCQPHTWWIAQITSTAPPQISIDCSFEYLRTHFNVALRSSIDVQDPRFADTSANET